MYVSRRVYCSRMSSADAYASHHMCRANTIARKSDRYTVARRRSGACPPLCHRTDETNCDIDYARIKGW